MLRHISHVIHALIAAQPSQEAVRAALIVSYRQQGYTLDNAIYLASK